MIEYKIKLTEAENIALQTVAYSPSEWLEKFAQNRARIAIDEILTTALHKSIEQGIQLPPDRDQIVVFALERGWIKTGKEITDQALANPINLS